MLGAKVPVLRLIQGSDGSVEALLAACQRQAVAFQAVLSSSFAEQWNGRLAMMGFVIGLGTELLTGQGILSQIGLG